MHFQKLYKKTAGRVNLLRHIRSSIYSFMAQRIYQSMIMPLFTYFGYISIGWSEFRKRMRPEASQSFHRNAVRRTVIDF